MKKKGKCGKQRSFRTAQLAYDAMRKIPVQPGGQHPVKVYWCGQHKAYHFGSKLPLRKRKL